MSKTAVRSWENGSRISREIVKIQFNSEALLGWYRYKEILSFILTPNSGGSPPTHKHTHLNTHTHKHTHPTQLHSSELLQFFSWSAPYPFQTSSRCFCWNILSLPLPHLDCPSTLNFLCARTYVHALCAWMSSVLLPIMAVTILRTLRVGLDIHIDFGIHSSLLHCQLPALSPPHLVPSPLAVIPSFLPQYILSTIAIFLSCFRLPYNHFLHQLTNGVLFSFSPVQWVMWFSCVLCCSSKSYF